MKVYKKEKDSDEFKAIAKKRREEEEKQARSQSPTLHLSSYLL